MNDLVKRRWDVVVDTRSDAGNVEVPPPSGVPETALLALLTRREHEVIAAVTRGLLNKQIAADLGISERMVKAHRARGQQKLGARSAAELGGVWERLHGAVA